LKNLKEYSSDAISHVEGNADPGHFIANFGHAVLLFEALSQVIIPICLWY
jgi:hypothetical protein